MSDEPLAALAMQKITDHIDACSHNYVNMTDTFKGIRDNIKDTNRLLISFISFVVATVVVFAGYSYVQGQTLASQLAAARVAQAVAVSQLPDKTADAVAAKLPPPTSNPGT